MKNLLLLSVASISLAGCATFPSGSGELCREIATFANSTAAGEERAITLETSWGRSKNHPDAMVSRDCTHEGYEPGKRLCGYLIENSGAEFPTNNFLSALSCLSHVPRRAANYVTYERLDAKVSAYSASGVRDGIEVSVEFGPNAENGTQALTISANLR